MADKREKRKGIAGEPAEPARLIAINNSPLLEYTTPNNEIMQIKRKF